MSTKKSGFDDQISDDDLQFFRDEVADVRPLNAEERVDTSKQKTSLKHHRSLNTQDEEISAPDVLLTDPDLREIEVEDSLFYAASGIQQKVQRKLRRGELNIEDELDLHGYTVAEAKPAIMDFIQECKRHHIRYVRIIHGKGFRSADKIPVLKTHVAYWLPQHPGVLAFASARPNDGGTGALYVILKSAR